MGFIILLSITYLGQIMISNKSISSSKLSLVVLFIFIFSSSIGVANNSNFTLDTTLINERVADPDPEEFQKNLDNLIAHFEKKGVDLNALIKDERFSFVERITKKFAGAPEVKLDSFEDYKKRINFTEKMRGMETFMAANQKDLDEAAKEYDIPATVIAAIIGVESSFGKVYGRYNPLGVYVSMYAEGHRSKFALAQLEELLEWTEKNDIDIFELKSSYAGAMSYAQFIPYSLNRWFVGNDLYNMTNNIHSVANYLAHFKKITGSVEKAVYRYNPSDLYTSTVMALANETAANQAGR